MSDTGETANCIFQKDFQMLLTLKEGHIRETPPCDLYPLIPKFYIVKLEFTGVYIFSYFGPKT